MNIIIVGAGAVGSAVAVALARAGEDVTALLRPEAVAESGSLRMQVAPPTGEAQWAIVPTVATLTEPPDLVLLCVPAHELAGACMTLAHLPAHIPVVALHGGPEADLAAQQALGRRVIGGAFAGSAEYLTVGQARVTENGLALDPAIREYPTALATLERALPLSLTPIAPRRWARLLIDLPQVFAALTDQPLPRLAEDRGYATLVLHLLTEATRALADAGIVPADLPGIEMARLRKLHTVPGLFAGGALKRETAVFPGERALPVTLWQRLRRRRTTEVDALHGAITRMAQAAGTVAPLHTRLVEAIHGVETSGNFLTPDALKRALTRG